MSSLPCRSFQIRGAVNASLMRNLAFALAGFALISSVAVMAGDKPEGAPDRDQSREEREAAYEERQEQYGKNRENAPVASGEDQPAPGLARARMEKVLVAVSEKDLEVNEMAPLLMQNMPQLRGLVPPSVLYIYTEGLLNWQTMSPEMQEAYKHFLTSAPYLQEEESAELRQTAMDFFAHQGMLLPAANTIEAPAGALNNKPREGGGPKQGGPGGGKGRDGEQGPGGGPDGPRPDFQKVVQWLEDHGVTKLDQLTEAKREQLREEFRKEHGIPDPGERLITLIGILKEQGITTTDDLRNMTPEQRKAVMEAVMAKAREKMQERGGKERPQGGGPGGKSKGGPTGGKAPRGGERGGEGQGPGGGGMMLERLATVLEDHGITNLSDVTPSVIESIKEDLKPADAPDREEITDRIITWLQGKGINDLSELTDERIAQLRDEFRAEMEAKRGEGRGPQGDKEARPGKQGKQGKQGKPGKGGKTEQASNTIPDDGKASPAPQPKKNKGVKAWGVPASYDGADKVDPDQMVLALNATIDHLLASRPNQGPKQVVVKWDAPAGATGSDIALPLMGQLTAKGAVTSALTGDADTVMNNALDGNMNDAFFRWEVAVDDLPVTGQTTQVTATGLWNQVLTMTPEAQQQLLYSIRQDAINETMLNLTPEDYKLPELYPDDRAARLVYQMLTKERGVKDLGNNFVQITALRLMQRVAPTDLAVAFDPSAQPEVVRQRVGQLQQQIQVEQAKQGLAPEGSNAKKAKPKGVGKKKLAPSGSADLGDYRLDCSRFTANLFLQFQQNPAYETGSRFTVIDEAGGQVIEYVKR